MRMDITDKVLNGLKVCRNSVNRPNFKGTGVYNYNDGGNDVYQNSFYHIGDGG